MSVCFKEILGLLRSFTKVTYYFSTILRPSQNVTEHLGIVWF